MRRVIVSGLCGRMGMTAATALEEAPDFELVGGADPKTDGTAVVCGRAVPVYPTLGQAIDELAPDIVVDFTHPAVVADNIECAMRAGVDCVVGTTGLSEERLASLAGYAATPQTALFYAPNFTTGAVLMMLFAETAARFFPEMEVIELHHCGKADAPSGTAVRTATMMAAAREGASAAPGKETELAGFEGARGALVCGVPVHSVRTPGHVASQEVILGSLGQTLTIRHDSHDRASYQPGILLACRKVGELSGLTIGLEKLMGL